MPFTLACVAATTEKCMVSCASYRTGGAECSPLPEWTAPFPVGALREVRTTSSTGGQKGVKLARHDLIPSGPLTALAEHYGRGARKYAHHQWRNGYELSKSYSALQRHALAWNDGHSYDVCSNDPEGCSHVDTAGEPYESPEPDTCFNHTGSHHMAAVAWHAFAIQETEARYPEHDDRFRPSGETS